MLHVLPISERHCRIFWDDREGQWGIIDNKEES